MSRGMWETIEIKAGETRVAKVKGGRDKRRSRKKTRRKGGEEKTKKTKEVKDNGSKKGSRGLRDLG